MTIQMKALDEYILTVLFMVLMKRVHFVAFFKTYLDRSRDTESVVKTLFYESF